MVITGLTRNQLESNLSGVRIPPSPPQRQNCYLIISNLPQILPLHTLVLTIRILSMTLSTASGETLEWREMVICGQKTWTLCCDFTCLLFIYLCIPKLLYAFYHYQNFFHSTRYPKCPALTLKCNISSLIFYNLKIQILPYFRLYLELLFH